MTSSLHASSWSASDLGNAVHALVEHAGLAAAPPSLDDVSTPGDDIDAWLTEAAERLGVEVVSVSTTCGELLDMLSRMGPGLLRLPDPDEPRYIAIVGGGRFGLNILTNEGVHRIDRKEVYDALVGHLVDAEQESASELLRNLDLESEIGGRGLRTFVLERLARVPLGGIWLLRPSPGAQPNVQARSLRVSLLLALLVVARGLSTVGLLALWWLIGRAVFADDGYRPSLGLWAMCALSTIPPRVLDVWVQSRLALDVGAAFKEALLFGVLHMDRATVRGRGIGQFLSTVMEGEISSTAMESALLVLVSLVELVAALFVLAMGGGDEEALFWVLWVGFTGWLCWRYANQSMHWVDRFRRVTHDLVERMIGYQTRLVQERPEDRHIEEDALLHGYVEASRELDRRMLPIDGVVGAGWLLVGIALLEPKLSTGSLSGASVAVVMGGLLLASNALKQFALGITHLVDVWVAWRQTRPIIEAGQQAYARGNVAPPAKQWQTKSAEAPLVRFDGVSFRYAADAPDVLHRCSQEIRAGDRILLEGPSGGGKSTLAIVLTGIRAPSEGTIHVLGERGDEVRPEQWRERVVLVPQFHDNHIMTESLLFNLLLGRGWPPTVEDERAAAEMCERFGLGGLLERMPQGLSQPVGDGGWALSHGERSRVFLARALLQHGAQVILLDESFAALDPETLRRSVEGVVQAAPTLVVIAHP